MKFEIALEGLRKGMWIRRCVWEQNTFLKQGKVLREFAQKLPDGSFPSHDR